MFLSTFKRYILGIPTHCANSNNASVAGGERSFLDSKTLRGGSGHLNSSKSLPLLSMCISVKCWNVFQLRTYFEKMV